MIFAELHDKLGENYSRAHERAEDLLTSTVFGLLRYLPLATGTLAALGRARLVRLSGSGLVYDRYSLSLALENIARIETDFWPHWGRYGQPDVVLTVFDRRSVAVGKVVVEAKLYAPKSGEAGDEDADAVQAGLPDPDQLVRYWQGLCLTREVAQGARPLLVYLTRHTTPPKDELEESLRRCVDMQLAWMSWCDVWQVAQESSGASLPAADLARLLAHKGLKYFTGFLQTSWRPPAERRFWNSRGWFSIRAWQIVPTAAAHFWRLPGDGNGR